MTKRTDVTLSAAILALVFLALVGMAVTGTLDEFGDWAWDRHHNILSWYIRALFLLPFCFFAYRRSFLGITLTLVALATSMFWFSARIAPTPEYSTSWRWRGSTSPESGLRRRSRSDCSCPAVSRLWPSSSGEGRSSTVWC